jgi:sensor c-di-GMP phosphodiesterase-like protein
MTACGIVAGFLLGCVLALLLATNWLDQYSQLTSAQSDASFIEGRALLNVLKDSRYGFCSDAEMAYFRELVFRSEYIKDAGRIHAGRIDCSATVGRPARTVGQFKPESLPDDGTGTIAYSNLVPIHDPGLKRSGLQMGNAYVVFGSRVPASPGPVPMHVVFNVAHGSSAQHADQPGTAQQDARLSLSTIGSFRFKNNLYATRCSTLHSSCVEAYTSIPEAMQGETTTIALCTLAGGGLGIVCSMAFSFYYKRSRDLCQQLRRAVERDKLQVVYQPIVKFDSRRIVGAEALARWTDEEGYAVGPNVFIKMAEEHGFIGLITKRVLQRTLHDFSKLLQSRPSFRLSINVAAADLVDPEFLPMLEDSLRRHKVQPKNLAIEITERATADSAAAMETIRILRHRGHSVHIDDFGTGYSNLDRLLCLFADTIKIDKAFTKVIGTESVAVAILPQILAMARSLGLEVIIEGIETERQADYFSLSNANEKMYGQGFLYGHPVTFEEFHGLLVDEQAKFMVAPTTETARNAEEGGLHIVASRGA